MTTQQDKAKRWRIGLWAGVAALIWFASHSGWLNVVVYVGLLALMASHSRDAWKAIQTGTTRLGDVRTDNPDEFWFGVVVSIF